MTYLVGGILQPSIPEKGIIGAMSARFLPVWIGMVAVFAASPIMRSTAPSSIVSAMVEVPCAFT